MAELADATDSKSVVRKDVWVRVPLLAGSKSHRYFYDSFFLHYLESNFSKGKQYEYRRL